MNHDHIEVLPRRLPPPFAYLDCVVRNKLTDEVGFRWDKKGVISYTWEFKTLKAAQKELGKL
jgi:hypothetical protein